jgi:hypothetical protein
MDQMTGEARLTWNAPEHISYLPVLPMQLQKLRKHSLEKPDM